MFTKTYADRDILGAPMPWGYGFCYRRLDLRETVLAVIPLNFVIGWVRRVYWRLAYGPAEGLEAAAWDRGYVEGLRDSEEWSWRLENNL